MHDESYSASYRRRADKTGQGHAGQKVHAGQSTHVDEAGKSPNKIFDGRSIIIALGYISFNTTRWGHLSGLSCHVRTSLEV
jgi:hypothetical protein